MNPTYNYHQGLLFITYLLINSDNEINDDELSLLHKMRIEEGMSDATFADLFKSIIGKSDREIYQIGIESLNRCPDKAKVKAFSRLYQMAFADKILRAREVRFILYATKLTKADFNMLINAYQLNEEEA